jgi:hypothetical protein
MPHQIQAKRTVALQQGSAKDLNPATHIFFVPSREIKRARWGKARRFFELLSEGKARYGTKKLKKPSFGRGKGTFKRFWVKRGKAPHWIATGRFNFVFQRMIKSGEIKPMLFELGNFPRYFATRDFSVSQNIKGYGLHMAPTWLAKRFEANPEEVKALQYEVRHFLEKVFGQCKKEFPHEFSRFCIAVLANVIVSSYDKETGKFKIFVVDV